MHVYHQRLCVLQSIYETMHANVYIYICFVFCICSETMLIVILYHSSRAAFPRSDNSTSETSQYIVHSARSLYMFITIDSLQF